jgi:hypothetical protein
MKGVRTSFLGEKSNWSGTSNRIVLYKVRGLSVKLPPILIEVSLNTAKHQTRLLLYLTCGAMVKVEGPKRV